MDQIGTMNVGEKTMHIDFKVIGGPLDGARGEFGIEDGLQETKIGLPFGVGANYVLDLTTGKAHHVEEFPTDIKAVKLPDADACTKKFIKDVDNLASKLWEDEL